MAKKKAKIAKSSNGNQEDDIEPVEKSVDIVEVSEEKNEEVPQTTNIPEDVKPQEEAQEEVVIVEPVIETIEIKDDKENVNFEIPEELEIIEEEESIFLTESEANLQFLLTMMAAEKESDEVVGVVESSGIICTLHVADSKSDLKTHPLYYLQYVKNPGIYKGLHGPEDEIIYPDDGQDKYKFMCKVMDSCFVKIYHDDLLTNAIEFRCFGIDCSWMRAMCEALWQNKTVKVLDLSRNVLNTDACFHLGELLRNNETITDINLLGCQIGPEGLLRLIPGLLKNKQIKVLNLENNNIRDSGINAFAPVFKNGTLEKLNLACNQLKIQSSVIFAKNIKPGESKISELDFSQNFFRNTGINRILVKLKKLKMLTKLNLSWNNIEDSETTAILIGNVLKECKMLGYVDISHNLMGNSLVYLSTYFPYTPQLQQIKMGSNQILPQSTTFIMENFSDWRVKMKILDLSGTNVTPGFVELYNIIKEIKIRRNTKVLYDTVLNNYIIEGPSNKEVALKRAQFLATKKKKSFASFVLRAQISIHGTQWMPDAEFTNMLRQEKLRLDKDLMAFMMKPYTHKKKGINIKAMATQVTTIWPDATPLDDVAPPNIATKTSKKDKKEKKGKKRKK